MARVREQPEREHRILYEIVVDAYDEVERAMGWHCYLQDALQVPFKAKCKARRATSPLEVGAEVQVVVQVVDMADEDDCMSEVFVLVKYGESNLAVPLAQLECESSDHKTLEAVADWHYWVARGYAY